MEPLNDDLFRKLTCVWDEGLEIHLSIFDGKRKSVSPSFRVITFCLHRKRLQASLLVHRVTKLRVFVRQESFDHIRKIHTF